MAGSGGGREAERGRWICHWATAALDPDAVVHDHRIKRLVLPEAAIPFLGSRKAGSTYLRDLLVVGAMAVVQLAKQESTKWHWVAHLLERHKPKAVAVVLANKNARITWAMMATGDALWEGTLAAA